MTKCSEYDETVCPIEIAVGQLSGKWKIVIIHRLSVHEVLRFGELQRKVPGITQRMLIAQLRELEESGIVERKTYGTVPPKVEYRLTPVGRSLEPVMDTLEAWGRSYEAKARLKNPTQ
jgi:DNA-binding HxlR family transcriptional regulator